MISTFIVNSLLGISMSYLWASLNALQIISYLSYFNVYLPANASSFFGGIIELADFNIVDPNLYFSKLFPWVESDAQSEGRVL